LFQKNNDGKYLLINFFTEIHDVLFHIKETSEPFNGTLFLALTEKNLLESSNINYEMICKSFMKLESNKYLFGNTLEFILLMIKVYDKNNKQILLKTALNLLDWLMKKDLENPPEIYIINRLQIIKRMRNLNNKEIASLNKIIKTATDNQYFVGANLLLGKIELAKKYFNEMPENEQIQFNKYPISKFW
jgi:hypothetical protein